MKLRYLTNHFQVNLFKASVSTNKHFTFEYIIMFAWFVSLNIEIKMFQLSVLGQRGSQSHSNAKGT
jgi:hypothetical protein